MPYKPGTQNWGFSSRRLIFRNWTFQSIIKMSNFTNPTSILPNLTNWCPISVQTLSVIILNDPKIERTTGMSSEGPKLGGGRYGSTWNGQKTKKTGDPPWRPPSRSSAPIRARPAAIGREIWPARSPRLALPPWPARAQGWWLESSPTAKTRFS